MNGVVSNFLRFAGRTIQSAINIRQFHALPNSLTGNQIVTPAIPNAWSDTSVRTKVIDRFPKSREYKRLKQHGWRARLKTVNGRRIIMRRILKGRFYLAH